MFTINRWLKIYHAQTATVRIETSVTQTTAIAKNTTVVTDTIATAKTTAFQIETTTTQTAAIAKNYKC